MNNKYIKSLGGEDEEEVLGSKGRIVSTEEMPKDEWQTSLRPQRLDDYIGQEAFKKNLKVYIAAAKSRKEALDHVLLYGPPGLGKTTMAKIIANELGSQFKVTSGPAIARPGELASILTTLQDHDVLFIDEIHRLNRNVEEILYSAMEDFALDIVMGKEFIINGNSIATITDHIFKAKFFHMIYSHSISSSCSYCYKMSLFF